MEVVSARVIQECRRRISPLELFACSGSSLLICHLSLAAIVMSGRLEIAAVGTLIVCVTDVVREISSVLTATCEVLRGAEVETVRHDIDTSGSIGGQFESWAKSRFDGLMEVSSGVSRETELRGIWVLFR